MSKFSGKCDFYDHVFMSFDTQEEAFKNFNGTKLYIKQPLPDNVDFSEAIKNGVNIPETYYKKVQYSTISDIVPYYPYLVSIAYVDNGDSKNSIVCLSSKSFVDIAEAKSLQIDLKNLIKIYNRCKRKKIKFNVDEAVSEVCFGEYNKEEITELANRVAKNGKNATIDGVHLPTKDYYRQKLVDEMVRFGVNPAEWGYERFK